MSPKFTRLPIDQRRGYKCYVCGRRFQTVTEGSATTEHDTTRYVRLCRLCLEGMYHAEEAPCSVEEK